MKVLVLSHMYPNNQFSINGIFVHQQVKALKKQGCEVKVISPIPLAIFPLNLISKKWERYHKVQMHVQMDGIDIYHPRYILLPRNYLFHRSGWFYYKAIEKLVASLFRDFDFDVILSHTALPDGFAGCLLSKKYKKPLITIIHGQDLQQTIYINKKCNKAIVEVLKNSNKIITVSNKLKTIAKTLIDKDEQYSTINNGFDLSKIVTYKSGLLDKYRSKKIILSIGHLIKIKGHDLTIQAFKKLVEKYQNLHLIIIGDGPEKEFLQSLVDELGLRDKVEFVGQVNHGKAMEYVSICDLFVLPSWNEGFGMVYIEAMAHGKPVVGVEGQGINDVIIDGENGFLARPRDIDSLYEKVKILLDDKELVSQIALRAKETIYNNLTWDANAKRLLSVIKEEVNTTRV